MAKKKQKSTPRFGGGILADNLQPDKTGKMNAYGIFTMFWAWDFPCQRPTQAAVTIFDIPKKAKVKVNVSVRKTGGKAKKVASFDVSLKDTKEKPPALISHVHLQLTFNSPGNYELIFSIPRNRNTHKIAFEVRQHTWPEFTKTEINYVKSNPDVIEKRRMNIHCPECKRAYIFEESILHKKPDAGVEEFPKSGKYKCISTNCKHTLELRDLQGLLRNSLKDTVKQAMGKKL